MSFSASAMPSPSARIDEALGQDGTRRSARRNLARHPLSSRSRVDSRRALRPADVPGLVRDLALARHQHRNLPKALFVASIRARDRSSTSPRRNDQRIHDQCRLARIHHRWNGSPCWRTHIRRAQIASACFRLHEHDACIAVRPAMRTWIRFVRVAGERERAWPCRRSVVASFQVKVDLRNHGVKRVRWSWRRDEVFVRAPDVSSTAWAMRATTCSRRASTRRRPTMREERISRPLRPDSLRHAAGAGCRLAGVAIPDSGESSSLGASACCAIGPDRHRC